MTKKILIATTNPGKIAELTDMVGSDIRWVGLGQVARASSPCKHGQDGRVTEDGATFAANARKKASGYAKATGLWTIADDSGLVVDALGGEPGVRSARYSGEKLPGEERTLLDHRNMAKVLKLLEGVPREKRTARFICRLCLASPQEILIETEGTLEGLIAERQAGRNGFGYDPIFFVPGLGRTVAQLTSEQKNAISHRGNAIRKLKPLLDELLNKV